MSTFCPNDQTVHEDAAVTCPSCSGRLTVLHPGTAFYHGRYRVERIVRKNAFSVSALVFEETNPRDEFILREIFPAVEVDLSAKQRFSQAVKDVLRARPACLPRIRYSFTTGTRLLLAEDHVATPSLRDSLRHRRMDPSEIRVLFQLLLAALHTLHVANPPILHGCLDASTVIPANSDKSVILLDPAAPFAWLLRQSVEPRDDLLACARTVFEALTGQPAGASPAPEIVKRIGEIGDTALAVVLEWLLTSERRPNSSEEVFTVLADLDWAWKPEPNATATDIKSRLDKAFNRTGATLLRSRIDEVTALANKEKTAIAAAAGAARTPPATQTPSAPLKTADPAPDNPAGSGESPKLRKPWIETAGTRNPTEKKVSFCLNCGATYQDGAEDCANCGAALATKVGQRITLATPAPQTPKPEPPKAEPPKRIPNLEPPLPTKPATKSSRWLLTGLAGAVFGVSGVVYYNANALERDFSQALERGEIVTPASESAYDIYQRAKREKGEPSSTVQEMKARVKPVLQAKSDTAFDRWYKNADLGDMRWLDVRSMQTWLTEIDSSNENRGRQAYSAGQVAMLSGEHYEAKSRFEAALIHKPGWTVALNGIGRACVNLKDPTCAEQFYLQAVQADRSWPFPHQNLGGLYLSQRRYDVSEQAYRQAISADPSRPGSHFLLGQLFEQRGFWFRPQACDSYKQALALAANKEKPGFDTSYTQRRINQFCR